MDFNCVLLELDRIDTSDFYYRITTTEEKPSLLDSIDRLGLICPIVVIENENQYKVVSGFRRIEACLQLQWKEIPCQILPGTTPQSSCADIAVSDNLSKRPLNIIEQANCLRLIDQVSSSSEDQKKMIQTLGLSPNDAYRTKLQKIINANENIQTGLIRGEISLPVALLLSALSDEDAQALLALFNRLPMGMNKQRELLLNLSDISSRDSIAIAYLLKDIVVQNILENKDMDGNIKTRLIRTHFKKKRYPRLVELEESFRNSVLELALGRDIQINPPPQFESSRCTMTIRFDSLAALKRAFGKLERTINHPATQKLFDCL